MKLFTRYNRINLLATAGVFLLAGVAFYFLLRFVLTEQVDDDLKIEQREIQSYVEKYNQLPEVIPVKDQHISYQKVNQGNKKRTFSTVKLAKEEDAFRRLDFFIDVNRQWYQATVSKSLEGTDDTARSIITITLLTIALMLVVSVLINRMLIKKLWAPFYDTLSAMRGFELGKKQRAHFPETSIDEFSYMINTLKETTAKAEHDYLLLKEFTENASHELQTPLAIIQSKLDLLIQDDHLSEPQSRAAQGAYEAIQKLSRLNQSLLLLAKIENGQYTDVASVNLSQRIDEKLMEFEEMMVAKNITITKDTDETTHISMNPMLADILLNNLLGNAVKYNQAGGAIGVVVKKGFFEISNPAVNGPLDDSRLFRRFGKTGHAKEGVGLGLAIIKQVADVSGFTTSYLYRDARHHFLFNWQTT